MTKIIWLFIKYLISLPWRLLKYIMSFVWELFVEFPIMMLLDDFEEYLKKKSITTGHASSDIKTLDVWDFYEDVKAKRAFPPDAEPDYIRLAIYAQAYRDYINYLHPGLVDHK